MVKLSLCHDRTPHFTLRIRNPGLLPYLGSASPHILRENAETLAGRIAYHELAPFSLLEINGEFNYREHWFSGGFPGALLAPNLKMSRKWLLDFTETFVTRDVKRLQGAVPEANIRNLLRMVAHRHGGLLNMSQLASSLDVKQPTVARYLDLLEGSFLVRRLQPFFQNMGKRLVKTPKIYLRDTGLLHRISGIQDKEALAAYPNLGASWEGYVIEQIIREAEEGSQFYFYRTSNGAETDLVWITDHGKIACCEIKYSVSPVISKGFYQTVEDLQPHFRYVIIPEGEAYTRSDGVRIAPLLTFLESEMAEIQR